MSESNFDCQSPREVESGYASGCSSEAALPDIFFSKQHLKFINQQLAKLEPEGAFHCRRASPRALLTRGMQKS